MNRFTHTGSSGGFVRFPLLRRLLLPLLAFTAMLLLLYFGIRSVSSAAAHEEQKSLENAVRRSIVHCYATEGRYPESLDYLISHYGIVYDDEQYFIDYQPVGTNIMPDVTIIPLN